MVLARASASHGGPGPPGLGHWRARDSYAASPGHGPVDRGDAASQILATLLKHIPYCTLLQDIPVCIGGRFAEVSPANVSTSSTAALVTDLGRHRPPAAQSCASGLLANYDIVILFTISVYTDIDYEIIVPLR